MRKEPVPILTEIANYFGIHQSTVSRIAWRVDYE